MDLFGEIAGIAIAIVLSRLDIRSLFDVSIELLVHTVGQEVTCARCTIEGESAAVASNGLF